VANTPSSGTSTPWRYHERWSQIEHDRMVMLDGPPAR
jgi:hypothetical protein